MRRFGAIVALSAGVAVHATAHAQDRPARAAGTIDSYIERVVRLREEVAALAFDPNKLFDGRAGGTDVVTVAYAGDDFGWPVFSMAIRRSCLEREKMGPHCTWRRVARMVRSPAPPDLRRPRQRGSLLMARMLRSDGPTRLGLDRAGLEWVEADLDSCPGAIPKFQEGRSATWVPADVFASGRPPMHAPVMHADNVKVVFADSSRRSTYNGYVAPGSPAQWAVELAATLDRCWRPLTAVPPWQR
jgi:hypothetical protein